MVPIAKIKYNVKGVDSRAVGSLPKPGLYTCKVIACVDNKPDGKDRRLEVQYEIQDKDNKGFRMYDYINLESEAARWKLKQFLEAMGVDKDSGTFDTDDFIGTALTVKVKIQPETEQYPASARPQTLLPLDGEEEDLTDEEEDLEEDEADDEEEDDDTEDQDEDEDDEGDDEAYTAEDLEELDKADLQEIAEEVGVDFPDGKFGSAKKRKLIADILAAQAGDEDDDADADDDEDDEEEVPDYDAMSLGDLKKLAKERGLKSTGTAKVLVARLKKSDNPF